MKVFQFKNNGSEPGPAPAAGLVVPCFLSGGFLYSSDKDYTADITAAVKEGRNVIFNYGSTASADKIDYAGLLRLEDEGGYQSIQVLLFSSGQLTPTPYRGKAQ